MSTVESHERVTDKALNEFTTVTVVGGCGAIGSEFVTAIAPHIDICVIDRDVERISECSRTWAADPHARIVEVTQDYHAIPDSDVVVVTIGTEGADGTTRGSLAELFEQIAPLLSNSPLVLIRSTADPGTARTLSATLALTAASDVDVVVAPERSLEGSVSEELFTFPQLLGGPERAVKRAARFFAQLGIETVPLQSWEAAEIAKLICNGYRYMTFQLANYFEMFAASYQCSYNEIHEAISRNYPRASGLTSAGFVGGPCLPKDTGILSGATPDSVFDLASATITMSAAYEAWVLDQIGSGLNGLEGKTIGILGLGFKAGSDDRRASRGVWLSKQLSAANAVVIELSSSDHVDEYALDCIVDVFGAIDTNGASPSYGDAPAPIYKIGVGWQQRTVVAR